MNLLKILRKLNMDLRKISNINNLLEEDAKEDTLYGLLNKLAYLTPVMDPEGIGEDRRPNWGRQAEALVEVLWQHVATGHMQLSKIEMDNIINKLYSYTDLVSDSMSWTQNLVELEKKLLDPDNLPPSEYSDDLPYTVQ